MLLGFLPTPEPPALVREDLYFGRRMETGAIVPERLFRDFLNREVTPRFPRGLTVLNMAMGGVGLGSGWQDPGKVVSLIYENTAENQTAIQQIVHRYHRQFPSTEVVRIADMDVAIAFDETAEILATPTKPHLIQETLYF
ncbi:MAG: DUF3574 domain-containing protein, partial [Oculatellaceae cyanobacterium Prado106]|nr:DUF3574 domain-containing protein [Oculatellaceae cyanobacterium Prado106]